MRLFILCAILIAAALVTPVCTLAGCQLHNPAPVTPGWPDESPLGAPRDAGPDAR